MLKTGIYFWFGYNVENRERFRFIREAGFDNVFLWWGDEYAVCDGDKELLPQMARNAGLEVESVHAPFDKANSIWTNSINAEDLVKMYVGCITDCARHNIPTAVVHLTNGDAPPPQSRFGLDRFKSLVEFAERKRVNIALENLRKPEYLEFIFSNIKSERLGFCYDSGHENCYTKDYDLLDKYGHMLMTLHLHDNDGTDDQHRIPGEGSVLWPNIVRRLKSMNYTGSISLEVTKEFSEKYSSVSAQEFLQIAHKKAIELFI